MWPYLLLSNTVSNTGACVEVSQSPALELRSRKDVGSLRREGAADSLQWSNNDADRSSQQRQQSWPAAPRLSHSPVLVPWNCLVSVLVPWNCLVCVLVQWNQHDHVLSLSLLVPWNQNNHVLCLCSSSETNKIMCCVPLRSAGLYWQRCTCCIGKIKITVVVTSTAR